MAQKEYKAPRIVVAAFTIENGFALSNPGMTEAIEDCGYYEIGDQNPWYEHGDPMTEGIISGQNIYFRQ
jgi:hypothetical protein